MKRLALIGVGALIAAPIYLLLIDNIHPPELYVLAGVALLSGLAFEVSREQGFVEARLPRGALRHAWRPLARAPMDIALLCREAIAQAISPRRVRGTYRAVSFAGGESPEDVGRRALAEALGSFAPNTIVIGVDADRGLLLVHQLHGHGGGDEVDVLRLG